jgi:hypothetical protein
VKQTKIAEERYLRCFQQRIQYIEQNDFHFVLGNLPKFVVLIIPDKYFIVIPTDYFRVLFNFGNFRLMPLHDVSCYM